MASQIVLMRELLIVFYGNELSIAFILASWLAGGAIGSAVLGVLSDRIIARVRFFGACQIALAAILPLIVTASRSIRAFMGFNAGEIVPIMPIAAASFFLLLPLCAVFGFLFSLASRIYKPEPVLGAVRIGQVYVLEAIGAIAGGLITSFVFIRFLNSIQIMAVLSLLLAASALLVAMPYGKNKGMPVVRAIALIALLANTVMWLCGGWAAVEKYSLEKAWHPNKIVASKNSIYSNIVLTRRPGQFSFFENGLHLYAIPDRQFAEEAVHFALLEHLAPQKVLLIGGGVGGLLGEIARHPVGKIDYAELDPTIVEMARQYLPLDYSGGISDERVSIIYEDGRRFVKEAREKYDVIIVSLGDPYTAQINRFYTAEFFAEARRILKSDGILSFGLTSSESFVGTDLANLLRSIYATLGTAFADIKIIPGETAYFLASPGRGMLTYDYKILMKRARLRGVELKYVREYYLFSRMSQEIISYMESLLRASGSMRINLDFRPISYYYGLIAWASKFRDSNFTNILKSVNEKAIWSFAAIIYMAILAAGFIGIAKKKLFRAAAIVSVVANGFSQMTFQVLVLLAFQAIYGYMFYKIGIITTAFMAGIALGGWTIVKALPNIDHRVGRRILVLLQGGLCVYPFILIAMLNYFAATTGKYVSWAGANMAFIALPIISGFLGGAIFPVAGKIYLRDESKRGRTAGLAYGADLFGSCAGAVLAGIILVPVLGIMKTCAAVAAVNLSILLVLIAGVVFL